MGSPGGTEQRLLVKALSTASPSVCRGSTALGRLHIVRCLEMVVFSTLVRAGGGMCVPLAPLLYHWVSVLF